MSLTLSKEGEQLSINLAKVSLTQQRQLESLLANYQVLFNPPTALPPDRMHDRYIPLKSGTVPIAVKPYRYPYFQKNEIERQIRELLQSGTIQPTSSPYYSPVLLVKKKDRTWRMCVDYRALDKATVKDRFPIPNIDELLDELHGSCFFSKPDLRYGYHQIQMHEDDIPKTALSTHYGHYEFKVMPFGLSNASSTFQALMNHIF